VDKLRVGMSADVTVDGLPGQTFHGRIARMSPATNPNQRMYTVEVQVSNPQELIRPGMFCRVSILLETIRDAIVVSRDCLVEDSRRRVVYVVQDGAVAIVPVEVGASSDNSVQIVSGLRDGDLVICSGQSLLAKGQRVTPKQETPNNATSVPKTEEESVAAPAP